MSSSERKQYDKEHVAVVPDDLLSRFRVLTSRFVARKVATNGDAG